MSTVVFVPSAPLLLFDAGPPGLRAAITDAVSSLREDVVVVGAAPTPGWWTGSVDRTPYGDRGAPASDPLPLALAVGAHLLGPRPHRLWGVPSGPLPGAGGYLVVADGTAKRSQKAPGHLDPRAQAFDDVVVDALAAGDPESLGRLDPLLGEELWVQGLPAWRSAAGLPGPWSGAVTYAEAPYGVGYVVASWTQD